MTMWTRVKEELDRAGRVAQGAFDEGKVRLELMRTRELADRAAQALGYAVYRAKQQGAELDGETFTRLSTTLTAHETDAARQEETLKGMREARRHDDAPTGDPPDAPAAA